MKNKHLPSTIYDLQSKGFTARRRMSTLRNSTGGGLFRARQTHPGSHRRWDGFTLIELLVVISIIAILVAVGAVNYQRTNKLSRDAKRKADLEQIRQALETYRSENGTYPPSASWQTDLSPNYITTIPSDPKSGTYVYAPGATPIVTYGLCAYLELGSGTTSCTATCGPSSEACNYEVANP